MCVCVCTCVCLYLYMYIRVYLILSVYPLSTVQTKYVSYVHRTGKATSPRQPANLVLATHLHLRVARMGHGRPVDGNLKWLNHTPLCIEVMLICSV